MPAVLTSAGAELLGHAQALVDDVETRMLSGLTEHETAALGQALGACAAALEGPPSPS
ncbi:hypothetical protein J7E83_18080 [Arthrobacter sp. ISL-48]|uniref:hypothetical protein n=1 Tax=Arthrobacter sp. ISL-48 TaxID=2819110 RepID=UPI001BEA8D1B|nr:hypothetical protein [Arthrobacter sp. ISL-48]MBT2533996.1 hypothetical protein [Arthrobacter sp. ISL-48]